MTRFHLDAEFSFILVNILEDFWFLDRSELTWQTPFNYLSACELLHGFITSRFDSRCLNISDIKLSCLLRTCFTSLLQNTQIYSDSASTNTSWLIWSVVLFSIKWFSVLAFNVINLPSPSSSCRCAGAGVLLCRAPPKEADLLVCGIAACSCREKLNQTKLHLTLCFFRFWGTHLAWCVWIPWRCSSVCIIFVQVWPIIGANNQHFSDYLCLCSKNSTFLNLFAASFCLCCLTKPPESAPGFEDNVRSGQTA